MQARSTTRHSCLGSTRVVSLCPAICLHEDGDAEMKTRLITTPALKPVSSRPLYQLLLHAGTWILNLVHSDVFFALRLFRFFVSSMAQTAIDTAVQFSNSVRGIGLDLIDLIVSDTGLASTSPTWWNGSPRGCLLLGLQPQEYGK